MMRTVGVWSIAVIVTLGAAVYQRLTGPTHPLRGSIEVGGETVKYRLPRTHGGDSDCEVELPWVEEVTAELRYRRYPTEEPWTPVAMRRDGERLVAELPHQPPAGKLEYFVAITGAGADSALPADRTAVIRFKGGVPLWVLMPHVFFMFLAMLFSNAAGVEAALGGERLRRYALIAATCLGVGGLILGPIVQKLAFGDLWTGIPFGYDLTDNKTLIAALVWGAAVWQLLPRAKAPARWWVLAAALVLLGVYSIPHSALGSQLDPNTGTVQTGG